MKFLLTGHLVACIISVTLLSGCATSVDNQQDGKVKHEGYLTYVNKDRYAGEMIDGYSMINPTVSDPETIIKLMDASGVSRTLLSRKGLRMDKKVADLAKLHPNRVVPLLAVSNINYYNYTDKLVSDIEFYEDAIWYMMESNQYAGLGDLHVYRPEGTYHAKTVEMRLNDPIIEYVSGIAAEHNWPLIFMLQFSTMPKDKRDSYLDELSIFLDKHRDINIVLVHSGGLKIKEVQKLISTHKNIYFFLSFALEEYSKTRMKPNIAIDWFGLKPEWKTILENHSDRFIFSLYNFAGIDWNDETYPERVELWRRALAMIPPQAAENIAYKNAIRLWTLD